MVPTLIYLEDHQIQHRDIKPENLMLKYKDDISFVKLGDFGLSRDTSKANSYNCEYGSTPCFMAPEESHNKGCCKSDVWSLGVTMFYILCGKYPFTGKSSLQILCKTFTEEIDFGGL